MVDCSSLREPVILIADRGFESYNSMCHVIRKGWNFLIRAKDAWGILHGLNLPEQEELDLPVHLMLTCKKTNRKLKYTVGLLCFYAKKAEHILREIFARLIMYNLAFLYSFFGRLLSASLSCLPA